MHAKVKSNLTVQLNLDLTIECKEETKEILRFMKERKNKLDSLEPLGNGVSLVERGGINAFKILEIW
jgi:hypothetical protein